VKLLGTHMVVLNSAKAAFDLFEKRSAIYSDRPRMPMLREVMRWDAFVTYPYGNKWRASRRMFHQYFRDNTAVMYRPHETKATHELLYRLAHTPENLKDLFLLMAGSLILNITYGIDVQSADDPYIRMVEDAAHDLSAAGNPGSFLVDTFPILKHVPEWFPGAGFKKRGRELQKNNTAAITAPFQYVKDSMAKGLHASSVASRILERWQGDDEMESLALSVSGQAYFGGADTTAYILLTFIYAMILHPDVVRKAHEEIDRVVGQDRLPNFSDKPFLPYIGAIINEVNRWRPVAPLGVAHSVMEDDVYEGMFIPAGSIVVGNAWALFHDPNVYKNPETFNPERFLKDGKLDPHVVTPDDAMFGFGRRICPGRHLASESLFLNVVCILAMFDIEKALDEHGKPIMPKEEFTSGTLSRPVPFKYSIKPRSEQAYSLISDAYEAYHQQN